MLGGGRNLSTLRYSEERSEKSQVEVVGVHLIVRVKMASGSPDVYISGSLMLYPIN